MATRKDVAIAAGVSVATVSHVINKNKYVSDELKIRVEEAIRKLDYKPSFIARSLSTKKTYQVGIIVNDISNSYYCEIAMGMSEIAYKNGYTVSIYFTGSDSNKFVADAIQRQLDGLFVATNGEYFTEEQVEAMRANNMVFVNSLVPNIGSTVTFDYGAAIEKMMDYLVANNHKNIGFLCGMPKTMLYFIRYERFIKALQERNLPVLQQCIIENENPYSSDQNDGYIAMKKLLKADTRVTAVFCLNDLMALGAMRAIREEGLRIPEDISVIGCDDVFFASCVEPTLTTLSVPKKEMGREAMRQLLNQMKNGKMEDILLDVGFVVRESTGPAPDINQS